MIHTGLTELEGLGRKVTESTFPFVMASKPRNPSVKEIFDIEEQAIGEGAFGVVYRGKHKVTGQSVALKTFKKGTQGEPISQTVYREISVRPSLS